jgi:Transglycosylase SLT domain
MKKKVVLVLLFVAALASADVIPHGSGLLCDVALRSRECGVPLVLACRLIQAESEWNTRAIGDRGKVGTRSLGLLQLNERYLPEFARLFNGSQKINPFDPRENIRIGLYYLRSLYRQFQNWQLSICAFNAGWRRIKYGMVPDSTGTYARRIFIDGGMKWIESVVSRDVAEQLSGLGCVGSTTFKHGDMGTH